MQFVRKSRLNFFILQIREIDFDVHSRSIDTSMHCEKANTDIRNRSWIASRSHFSQKDVGLRRGVHNPKWHLCREALENRSGFHCKTGADPTSPSIFSERPLLFLAR